MQYVHAKRWKEDCWLIGKHRCLLKWSAAASKLRLCSEDHVPCQVTSTWLSIAWNGEYLLLDTKPDVQSFSYKPPLVMNHSIWSTTWGAGCGSASSEHFHCKNFYQQYSQLQRKQTNCVKQTKGSIKSSSEDNPGYSQHSSMGGICEPLQSREMPKITTWHIRYSLYVHL